MEYIAGRLFWLAIFASGLSCNQHQQVKSTLYFALLSAAEPLEYGGRFRRGQEDNMNA